MSTTIEQAITTILRAQQPITVANVLAAYLQIAGFLPLEVFEDTSEAREEAESAIIAFEHALDKHPRPPQTMKPKKSKRSASTQSPQDSLALLQFKRLYMVEVAELRKQYWQERLGCAGALKCTCTGCGKFLEFLEEEFNTEKLIDSECSSTRKKGGSAAKRRKHKKRVAKRAISPTESESSYDPYGPSTSAFVL
ncbi:hypothetical protein ABKN59_010217 [Abortiporus biennis]